MYLQYGKHIVLCLEIFGGDLCTQIYLRRLTVVMYVIHYHGRSWGGRRGRLVRLPLAAEPKGH